jgi:predicted ribosomally synthesized peptide with SipW-like signal peptide
MGAVGAAGAAAGMGTSALFSDEESFEDNAITAGTLDMKVDWEEHYSYPQLYGLGDPASDLDVTRSEPQNPDDYTAFPPGVGANDSLDPLLWVNDDDVSDYMDNTSIEAFPDSDDDGVQDEFDEANACSRLPDVGGDEDGLSADDRTDNGATNPGDPLVNLGDVKPGDFGEVALSFHLCNNDGYVWLNADNVSAAENSVTEPEVADDPDNDTVTADGSGDGELLEAVQTAWWYDNNCNNLTDGEGGTTGGADADVALVLDDSGSIDQSEETAIIDAAKAFIDELAANDQAATVAFGETASVTQQLTELNTSANVQSVKDAIDTYEGSVGGSSTNIDGALEAANGELDSSRARQGATPVIVVLSDGSPTTNNGIEDATNNPDIDDDDDEAAVEEADKVKSSGKRIISLGFGLSAGGDAESLMQAIAGTTANSESEYADYESGSGDAPEDEGDYFSAPDPADLQGEFEDIAGVIGQEEEIFYQDTLGNALDALTSGDGIPLDGDGGNDFDEIDDDPDADSRGCFPATPETNCIGFSWWVPTDVDNRIQSDSASFDLGFYAEQCRNNDGSGQDDDTDSSSV